MLFRSDPVLGEVYDEGETIFENAGVRLWHMGDDIAILSCKTKMNIISVDVLDGIVEATKIAEIGRASCRERV